MSRLKDLIKKDPVHERKVELRSYPLENDQIIVEGWLKDERLVPAYYWDGSDRLPGVVHWMCVRLLIGDWPLRILDAEAEMPGVPQELCIETAEMVKKIIDVPIVAGYTEEIRRRLGGIECCAHLTYLIVTMGPAALHGYWTQKSRERQPVPKSFEDFKGLKYLVNSCYLWREEGPLIQKIRKTIDSMNSDET